jgi:putative addiction module component (TIGR02574 family)
MLGQGHSLMATADVTELLALPADQKLDLIEALWDSLDPTDVPMPDWHGDVLDAREAADKDDPGEHWETVKARLTAKP